MSTVSAYTAKDITVLEGLEPVRKRPSMYIGGVDGKGLQYLVEKTGRHYSPGRLRMAAILQTGQAGRQRGKTASFPRPRHHHLLRARPRHLQDDPVRSRSDQIASRGHVLYPQRLEDCLQE